MPSTPNSVGYLTVAVVNAGGAYPLPDAVVTVDGEGVSVSLMTDRSGRTETLSLPTPPLSDSFVPFGTTPFSVYDITVTRDGYYQNLIMSVPIFPTVHSTLPVTLVPFSEYDPGDNNPRSDTLITVREPNL